MIKQNLFAWSIRSLFILLYAPLRKHSLRCQLISGLSTSGLIWSLPKRGNGHNILPLFGIWNDTFMMETRVPSDFQRSVTLLRGLGRVDLTGSLIVHMMPLENEKEVFLWGHPTWQSKRKLDFSSCLPPQLGAFVPCTNCTTVHGSWEKWGPCH